MPCARNRPTPSPSWSIYVRDYLTTRFGERIAEDIKPLEIQKWLKSLNETGGLAWTTVAKIRSHAPHLKDRHQARARLEKSGRACRDAQQVELPRHPHHAHTDACDPEVLGLPRAA